MDSFFGIDLGALIKTVGSLGVFAIIFAESGLLIGLILPGDSLLFTAGFLASQGYFHIVILVVGSALSAILGGMSGYALGYRYGPKIFKRDGAYFLNPANLERTKLFYEDHGGKAIIWARFLPIIRTIVPILAGVGAMSYPIFLFYNILGSMLWVFGLTLSGYFLGRIIPGVDHYLVPIVILIIIVSMLPSLAHLLRSREFRGRITAFVKRRYDKRNAGKKRSA